MQARFIRGLMERNRRRSYADWPLALCCIISALVLSLAIVVIVGWVLGNADLVRIRPTWPAMQGNVAFAFIACSLAFLALSEGARWLSRAAALIAVLIGTQELLEYTTGFELDIDDLIGSF